MKNKLNPTVSHKQLLLYTYMVLVMVFLSSCSLGFNKEQTESQIYDLVTRNKEDIVKCIEENNLDKAKTMYRFEDVKIVKENGTVIPVFYCGGGGFGSSTFYYGFYYSPQNVPFAIAATETNCLLSEDDNTYSTKQIIDGFYYFEVHF